MIVGSLISILFLCLYFTFSSKTKTIVDPNDYPIVIEQLRNQGDGFDFLPNEINEKVVNKGLLYVPGFLQGGTIVSLRLKLPKEEILKLQSALIDSGREIVDDEGFFRDRFMNKYPKYGVRKLKKGESFFTIVEPMGKSFEIYLYKSDLNDVQKNWNHNFIAYTAISKELNEACYYADQW